MKEPHLDAHMGKVYMNKSRAEIQFASLAKIKLLNHAVIVAFFGKMTYSKLNNWPLEIFFIHLIDVLS